MYLKSL